MCHCFGMVLVDSAMSKQFFHDWGQFCRTACGMSDAQAEVLQTRGSFFAVKTLAERDVDVRHLSAFEHEEALRRMRMNLEKREADADASSPEAGLLVPNGVAAAVETAQLVDGAGPGAARRSQQPK